MDNIRRFNEKDTDKKRKKFGSKKPKKVDKSIINSDVNNTNTKKNGNDPKKKKNKKLGWKIFKICLFVFIGLVIVGAGLVVGVVTGIIDKTDSVNLEALKTYNLTTFIYDKDGNEIASVHGEEDRVIVTYDQIPKTLYDAIISIEDERFEKHNGIDIKRTIGAVFNYVLNGGESEYGGSTITQQLVKNVTNDKEKAWTRKIREWYRAIELESKLSKEEIFESYANRVYLGDGVSGVQMASKNYFDKDVKDLNLAESAVIAALIQSPESYNPYAGDEQRETLLERQKLVLKQMLKLNKITQEQYDEAVNYNIEFKKDTSDNVDTVNSYFVDAVIEAVVDDLMEEQGVDEQTALTMVYNNGYKIYTTQDQKIQQAIDDAYNNTKLFYTDKAGDYMQSSMVVMDQYTGNVLGLIGGAGEKTGNRVLNRATQTKRQIGSTMKPLGAYGPAFELGISYPAMGVDDSELYIGDYHPTNYYGSYYGYVTVRDAIKKSMNIPAVRTCQKVGVDYSYNFAKNCGLTSLVAEDKNLASMALGGLTDGCTVLEMANAYSTIANGGIYMTPKLYTKVLNKDGNEELVSENTAKRVMKATTSYLLTSCLQSVVTSGTATGYVKVGSMPVAGKTGQTNDDKDQWFIGYTPYYTIACWNGYDQPKVINRGYPYTSVRLFNTVMNTISKDTAVKEFEKPDGIVTASVCKVSGLVPTDACRKDPRGDQTITDIFASGTVPTATCNIHKLALVDASNGLLAKEDTPNQEEKSFITRDYVPNVKPDDWKYMLPTEYSTNVKEETETTTDTNNSTINVY